MEVKSNYFGKFSLTVVLYDRNKDRLERVRRRGIQGFLVAWMPGCYEERYNLLNAFLAVLPANYRYNLRQLYILNSNYADLSFLFIPQHGEQWNAHLMPNTWPCWKPTRTRRTT